MHAWLSHKMSPRFSYTLRIIPCIRLQAYHWYDWNSGEPPVHCIPATQADGWQLATNKYPSSGHAGPSPFKLFNHQAIWSICSLDSNPPHALLIWKRLRYTMRCIRLLNAFTRGPSVRLGPRVNYPTGSIIDSVYLRLNEIVSNLHFCYWFKQCSTSEVYHPSRISYVGSLFGFPNQVQNSSHSQRRPQHLFLAFHLTSVILRNNCA